MKDIQKIKEFFSKPLEEGTTEYFKPVFRKDKSYPDFLYVDIAYPAGSGVLSIGGSKTIGGQDREEGAVKALSMGNNIAKKLESKYKIDSDDIEVKDLKNGKVQVFAVSDKFIKMASPSLDEAMDVNDPVLMKARAAAFQRTQPKPELPKPVKTINPDYKAVKNADKIKALKMRRAQLMSDMEQEAEPEGGPIANRYGRELNKIDQAISMLSEAKSNPEVDSTFNTNKVWAFIESKPFYNKEYMPKFSTAEEIWSEFGPEDKEKYANFAWTDTYGDNIHPREKSALQRKANYDKLAGVKEIDANDPILMQTRANTYQKSGKTINTKKEALLALDYIEPTIREAEEEEETAIDMAKKQLDALGIKYEMSGDKSRPFKDIYKPYSEDLDTLFNQEYELTRIYQNNKSEENWKKLSQIREKGKRLEKFDEIIYLFNLGSAVKQPMNEAQEEDVVDTITMDVPLFIRMLEYSREDAAEDMDLHDITEKANVLGKEKGVLSMEDYDAIVGAAEEIEEGFYGRGDKRRGLQNQSKLSSAEYQKAKKLKDFKASDWKWNADEDLYIKVVKEATDYMKRRKSENDYATSKEDKPKKSTNPNPSGKTDYMKRRQKELTETILAKLKR